MYGLTPPASFVYRSTRPTSSISQLALSRQSPLPILPMLPLPNPWHKQIRKILRPTRVFKPCHPFLGSVPDCTLHEPNPHRARPLKGGKNQALRKKKIQILRKSSRQKKPSGTRDGGGQSRVFPSNSTDSMTIPMRTRWWWDEFSKSQTLPRDAEENARRYNAEGDRRGLTVDDSLAP